MFIIGSLDEMFITALLDRQAEAVVAEAYPGVFIHRLAYASRAVAAVGLLLLVVVQLTLYR